MTERAVTSAPLSLRMCSGLSVDAHQPGERQEHVLGAQPDGRHDGQAFARELVQQPKLSERQAT